MSVEYANEFQESFLNKFFRLPALSKAVFCKVSVLSWYSTGEKTIFNEARKRKSLFRNNLWSGSQTIQELRRLKGTAQALFEAVKRIGIVNLLQDQTLSCRQFGGQSKYSTKNNDCQKTQTYQLQNEVPINWHSPPPSLRARRDILLMQC